MASVHIVVGAALDSPGELREALDAGADDGGTACRLKPEVLVARVAAGLRAARLRADEALLRSLVSNIPGALYRCAWRSGLDDGLGVSQEIEEISGYPVSDFIDSSRRTFASVIHPDDREQVAGLVEEAAGTPAGRSAWNTGSSGATVTSAGCSNAARPRRLGWPALARRSDLRHHRPPRGRASTAGKEVVEAQLAEVRASRARILDAADRAGREIERNLHDGAQQRFESVALELQRFLRQARTVR